MKKYFIPCQYVKSIYNIDLERLKRAGINTLIIDLDDTLLPRTESRIPLKTYSWIEKAKEEGFRIYLASNGARVERLNNIAADLGIDGSALAFKPFPFAFKKILSKAGIDAAEAAVIGDQLLTDILGGNLLGAYTILVNPLSPERSLIRIPYRIFEDLIARALKIKVED
ncbi:MAG: YqeG family HAD IIIA-type phosphatase [Candidatus Margulisiibacteriota bacterium]